MQQEEQPETAPATLLPRHEPGSADPPPAGLRLRRFIGEILGGDSGTDAIVEFAASAAEILPPPAEDDGEM